MGWFRKNIYSYFWKWIVVDTWEHKEFINEIPLNYPKGNREKMAQIMFETFNDRGLNIENQAILSLNVSGKFTGRVVELSDSYTHFFPIFDLCTDKYNIEYQNIGERDLTEFMLKLLIQENGHDSNID